MAKQKFLITEGFLDKTYVNKRGKTVTSIDGVAFDGCSSLTSILVPSGITYGSLPNVIDV